MALEVSWASMSVPLDPAVQSGHLVIRSRDYCCVRVVDDAGHAGEAFVLTRGLDVAGALERLVVPHLLTGPDEDFETRVRVRLRNLGWDGAISRACSAAALALFDAQARGAGLPAWRLLAAEKPPDVPAVVVLGYTPVGAPPDERADALRAAADGARSIKLMGGVAAPEDDLARAERVRAVVGEHCEVALDVNGAWTPEQARSLLPRAHRAGIAFLEEPWPYELGLPCEPDAIPDSRPQLAFGEVSASTIELETLARQPWVDHLRADATLVGGPRTFAGIVARGRPAAVMPHFWSEYHRHLVAAFPGPVQVEVTPPAVGGFALDRFVDEPARVVGGCVPVPDAPGFGIRLDWDAITHLAGRPVQRIERSPGRP